jgi:hypothetical protein
MWVNFMILEYVNSNKVRIYVYYSFIQANNLKISVELYVQHYS